MAVANAYDFYAEANLLHPLVVGLPLLIIFTFILRVTSARSMAPTSIVSWLLTVALGSTLSRALTQPNLNLTRALIAIAVLLLFEWILTGLIARSPYFARTFRAAPVLLVFRGELCRTSIAENRMSELGVYQALRGSGIASLDEVEALLLEGNGTFSVVKRLQEGDPRDVLMFVPEYALILEKLGETPPQRQRPHSATDPRKHATLHRHLIGPARYHPKEPPLDLEQFKHEKTATV